MGLRFERSVEGDTRIEIGTRFLFHSVCTGGRSVRQVLALIAKTPGLASDVNALGTGG